VRWARDLVCIIEVGRCKYMRDAAIICYVYVNIVRSTVSHYVCCGIIRTYIYIHIQCAILYKNVFSIVIVLGSLIYSSCYYILLL